MMVIDNKYTHGDVVYILTDEDQNPCIITGLKIQPQGNIVYEVSRGSFTGAFYDFELSETKHVLNNY